MSKPTVFTVNQLTTILEALERALDCGVCDGRALCQRCNRFHLCLTRPEMSRE